ncbi:MAG TPA: sulfatase-like hydrolase/transferase [Polyangiaceae bacterium]|nr:sulfatase-like hydrolase/transferase [Polyangiaceae bacterium]
MQTRLPGIARVPLESRTELLVERDASDAPARAGRSGALEHRLGTRWSRASARPLPVLSPGLAFALGATAGACLLGTELASSLFDVVDVPCVALALGLGTLIGALPAWATRRVTSRRVLVTCLLSPAPVLGAPTLVWALRRAGELEVPFVTLAGLAIALPFSLVAATVAKRLLGRSTRIGRVSSVFLAIAIGVTVFVFAALTAQAVPVATVVLGSAVLASAGWLALASGVSGPLGPWCLAGAIALELPRVDRSYFALRSVALGVALGAALLGVRELTALRPRRAARPLPVAGWRTVALGLTWLAVAVGSERLVTHHPHAFTTREQPNGAFGATIEALRRVTDFDGDGHASLFGGRDCAPFDATRSPGAHEIPNNGRDDNCTGGDAKGNPQTFLRDALAVNPPPAPVRRDAVLVVVDTMRADAVGPNLAAFAREGRRFTRAYSTASLTVESFVGILTGSLPTAADYRFFSPHDAMVEHLPPTVFAAARRAGYATGIAGGVQGRLSAAFFRDADVPRPLTMLTRADETTDTAIDVWHELDARKPRLMLVHYLALHATRGRDDYYRTALAIDAELARLWRAVGEDPVWIVTADHGESFGEHGVYGHSTALYRDELAVPLVVRYPGILRGEESAVTSLIGISPTLIALIAPEELAEARGPFLCLGQAGCGDVPAASALEKPFTHIHSLVLGDDHAFHGLIADRNFEFDLARDVDELRPLERPGAAGRSLSTWEELGFVQGARVPWFKQR